METNQLMDALKNVVTNELQKIELQGVFIAIGNIPNTELFIGQIETIENYIKIKDGGEDNSTATNIPGVFAAGDVANRHYRQAITAAAMGCMAALDAKKFLNG
jgi:thioredoxin reductase (NADPH)